MPSPFLTARWSNVAIISYAVPAGMLEAYLPAGAGLEIDRPPEALIPELFGEGDQGFDGPMGLVSLVAFEFSSTRVMGIKWPGFVKFPEINLRFYVKQANQRGVVFIREVVPRRLIAAIARGIYNEPYVTAAITSEVKQHARHIGFQYTMTTPAGGLMLPPNFGREGGSNVAGGTDRSEPRSVARGARGVRPTTEHVIRLLAEKPAIRLGPETLGHWFKEHRWGFGADKQGRATVYEVIHPTWGVYKVIESDVRVDFAAAFGGEWGFLSQSRPVSIVVAVGSEVAVFPKRPTVAIRWGVKR